jgi:tetratricopeptide (TPR) repeat protein
VASILKIQIDKLSEDIARSVSLYERVATPTEMRIIEVTTTSMRAYNYFLRGREDFEKHYYDDAIKYLGQALEIDSTFASAYLYLALVHAWLNDINASDSVLEKAMAFADRSTDKERLYIRAFYEKNLEKRSRILEQLATKYPKEKWVHVLLGKYYGLAGLTHRAIKEFRKALELDLNYRMASNLLAYSYAETGDYAKARECFKQYAAASPGDANPFDSMGDLYFQMGQLDEALAQYKEALFIDPDFYSSSGKIAYIHALRENYDEAMKWIDYFIDGAPSSGIQGAGYSQRAFYNYLLGNSVQALNDFDAAEGLLESTEYAVGMSVVNQMRTLISYDRGKLESSRGYLKDCYANLAKRPYNTIFYNFCLGLIELRQGTLDSTKTRLALIKSLLPHVLPNSQDHVLEIFFRLEDQALFMHDILDAEVLLAQDSVERAIAVCERMPKVDVDVNQYNLYYGVVFFKDILARIYLKEGDIDRAVLEYERLFDHNTQGRCLIQPTWHCELAKLYEEKGEKQRASEEYEKFIDIWKDADADRLELIDAKKRLSALRTD